MFLKSLVKWNSGKKIDKNPNNLTSTLSLTHLKCCLFLMFLVCVTVCVDIRMCICVQGPVEANGVSTWDMDYRTS